MVDMSNPLAPIFAGCYQGDGYTHDAHCVVYAGPDETYKGREVCFCANEDTVTIVDVTEKGSPDRLSRTRYKDSGYSKCNTVCFAYKSLQVDGENRLKKANPNWCFHPQLIKDGFLTITNTLSLGTKPMRKTKDSIPALWSWMYKL